MRELPQANDLDWRLALDSTCESNMPLTSTPPTFVARLETQDDWARKLGRPSHMKVGRSAHGLCTTWLEARTIPVDVRAVLDSEPELRELTPLIVIAEHQVPLEGGRAASQCDAWVLARKPAGGLVSIGVEAKVDEPFGETAREWLKDASPGRHRRLRELKDLLGLSEVPSDIHYQLLHRAAAPVIEAKRFGADTAVLLVQSFDTADTGLSAYQTFLRALGGEGRKSGVTALGRRSGVDLYAAWVQSPSPDGYVPARPKLYSRRIDLAMRVAAVAHAEQFRKGTRLPYISHPVHVSRLLEFDGWSEDVIIAGLLHDVVEDLDPALTVVQDRFRAVFPNLNNAPQDAPRFGEALKAFLTDSFGAEVMRLVLAVTEQKRDALGSDRGRSASRKR